MFNSNHIKTLLGIKDEFIQIDNVETILEDGIEISFISGKLSYDVQRCPHCGCTNDLDTKKLIVKNGSKPSQILMCNTSIHKTFLHLKKQRYHCRNCKSHFTCESTIVDRHSFISKQVKFNILASLVEKSAASTIAKRFHVSWSTVQRVIQSLAPYLNRSKEWLPTCLMVDEFRSMKSVEGKMSFICADGDTGKLFDLLPSRRLDYLTKHFNSFTYEARKQVKYIVTDMNAPYFELVKQCFPNAKVIVDRFHIIQHLNRCFNNVRIRIMKALNQSNTEQSKQYHQLKSLYKLLLKRSTEIDCEIYKKWRNFNWTYLTEKDVVHRLLSISDELKTAYNYYQDLLSHFKNSNDDQFFKLVKNMPTYLPSELKHVKKAFIKYENGIRLAMKQPYSNGKIESKNTHIKTLKRVCYGFKCFSNMKVRIFLQNKLIQIH